MTDYSEFFKKPSLKEARSRKREVHRIDDAFYIPNEMKEVGKGKYFYLHTYGCQANERDSETIAGILKLMQYQETVDIKKADIIILNTCAIRENAEEKVFGRIGYVKNLKKTNPDLIFAISGCMPQEEVVINRILAKHHHVDLIFGTHNIHRLPVLLQEAMFNKERVVEVWSKEGEVVENTPAARVSKHKAWVNIMYGCNKFCTYCIVPYTRGKERSRLKEDIVKEVEALVAQGYQEVTLLGQNVNSYGLDLNEDYDFSDLLVALAETGIPRIRFTSPHPRDFTFEMVETISKYPNIMPAIHLPVQSGNNEVLKRMARGYDVDTYLKLFNKIKELIPSCTITTDIIVGFPNETKEEFEDTLKLYNQCQYDLAYTFVYSPRSGTPAAKMKDNVPLAEKNKRLYELNEVVNKWANFQNKKFLNKTVKVLVDGASKKDEHVLSGYTENNKLVNFRGDDSLIGQIVDVKITAAKTWTLDGELVAR